MAPSFQWWAKESHRGTLVVVKMKNPNRSMVELEGLTKDDFLITTDSPGSGHTRDKGHQGRKNAKQLTWVLLLKAHRVASYLTSITSAMFGLAALIRLRLTLDPLIRRRLASDQTNSNEIKNENDDAAVEGMRKRKRTQQ